MRNFKYKDLTNEDCLICKREGMGEYGLHLQVEKNPMGTHMSVISRACEPCWKDFNVFDSKLDNHVKYGFEKPALPKNSFVRNYVLKNREVRKFYRDEVTSKNNLIDLSYFKAKTKSCGNSKDFYREPIPTQRVINFNFTKEV